MYPLKFKPILKPLIWGGEKIAPFKGIETDLHNIGESWEISCVPDNVSVVENGPLAGKPLTELIAEYKGRLVGKANYEKNGTEFPLLVKFIDARQDLSVQVRSAVKLCKTFVPLMAKPKRGRVLFKLTSYLIGVPPKNTAAYIMTKSALGGLAKSLAADYAPFGVTVNCVAPSMMETRFLADTSDLIVQASAEANPMGRNARVEDVVPAMEFLLGDEAGFITGVTLPITGGSAF